MVSKKIKLQREAINSALAKIVESSKKVDVTLESEIHPRGTLHRALDSSGYGHIVHFKKNGGFRANYISEDGITYLIDISPSGRESL